MAYASGVSFDSDAESDANRSVMLSLPYVEDGACSSNLLTDGLSGEGVTTDNGAVDGAYVGWNLARTMPRL